MGSRQEQRAEETKNSILAAAGSLFASKGFDTVTMREIAKAADCSHTTIYIYFKDKESLLQQLAMPPLQLFMEQLDSLQKEIRDPLNQLRKISLAFIEFCLSNRNMYNLFFNVKSVRVDEAVPELELNKLRNTLFSKLGGVLQMGLGLGPDDDKLLMNTRIYFYTLHGIVATYRHSEETTPQLMDRLKLTFEEAFNVLIRGFGKQDMG